MFFTFKLKRKAIELKIEQGRQIVAKKAINKFSILVVVKLTPADTAIQLPTIS